MTTPQAQFSNPKIPTYLPLSEAAQKYGLSEKALTQLKIFRKLRRHRVPGMVEMAIRPENVHHMDLGSDDQPGNYFPFSMKAEPIFWPTWSTVTKIAT